MRVRDSVAGSRLPASSRNTTPSRVLTVGGQAYLARLVSFQNRNDMSRATWYKN
jgi:hypothetical protein